MRPKIRYDLLFRNKQRSKSIQLPIQTLLYQTAYKYLNQMKLQIRKPFTSICIHGNYPQYLIPNLITITQNINKITIHSHLYDQTLINNIINNKYPIQYLNSQIPIITNNKSQQYDLIISCLQAHHYDVNSLMSHYISKLKPDGAILGCCFSQNCFKQLKLAYMMAENQRSGGISPKIYGFPAIGTIGHQMTLSQVKLPSIVMRNFKIQVDSFVDILTIMQMFGQSGILQGRRKGTYKDLLLATSAYYDSQFKLKSTQPNKKLVQFTLQLGLFIGWKQHESQSKPLTRGKFVDNSFMSEMIKNDPQSKIYEIRQQHSQVREIDKNQFQKSINQKQKQLK